MTQGTVLCVMASFRNATVSGAILLAARPETTQRTVPYVHVPLRVLRASGRNWHRIGVDFWPEIGYYSATDSDGKVFSERE